MELHMIICHKTGRFFARGSTYHPGGGPHNLIATYFGAMRCFVFFEEPLPRFREHFREQMRPNSVNISVTIP